MSLGISTKNDEGADGDIPEEKLEDGVEERLGGKDSKGVVSVNVKEKQPR